MVVKQEKLSEELASRIESVAATDMVDIVVEIEAPASKPPSVSATITRFKETSTPVTQTIEQVGGEVIGSAWINSTVRARVPASAVSKVAALQNVERIDIPSQLRAEAL